MHVRVAPMQNIGTERCFGLPLHAYKLFQIAISFLSFSSEE